MTAAIRVPAPSSVPSGHSRLTRRLGRLGGFLLAIGLLGAAAGGGPDGIFWAVVGAGMLVPLAREMAATQRAHREDLHEASLLAGALRSGRLPDAVAPTKLRAEGLELGPDETCFVDGVPVELLVFYGDPIVKREGFLVVWGSLFAWCVTAVVNYLWWTHNRAQARKAAPRWRDAEPARLWVTDRRYVIRSLAGDRAWFDLPWDLMSQVSLFKDGIGVVLDGRFNQPYKIRLANPTWHYALLRRLAYGQVDGGLPPRAAA